MNNNVIQDDILRYKRNSRAGNFALLGLVFNCLYFMLLYSMQNAIFYKPIIGASVILTLASLLLTFWSSESVKSYDKRFCYVLFVLAAIQVVRIFILPLQILGATDLVAYYFGAQLNNVSAFVILSLYLVLSAASLVAGGVFGYLGCVKRERHLKAIADGSLNIDAVLAEEEPETSSESKGAEVK